MFRLFALSLLIPTSALAYSQSEAPPEDDLQKALTVQAKFPKATDVGENLLEIYVADNNGNPIKNAKIELSVNMTNMDMGTAHPKVSNKGDGTYAATINFGMMGPWRVSAKVEAPGFQSVTKSFDFNIKMQGGHEHEMDMGAMMGRLGPWSMQKEGSGTSWLPESSPMFMKMLPKAGKYDLNTMGFITFNQNDAGGLRGDDRFFSSSMLMLMGRRETGGGVLGLSLMASLDPVFNGQYGYPNLFQTGETAYGVKLTDYQHPHDLLAEVAGTYSKPIGGGKRAFLYLAPVGEPALGGPVFMHRPSGFEIPEAPISHHWFDSTHISWGVVTLGANSENWQIEASAFNGHEPDEDRYAPDPIELNSASARITHNPNKNFSFNVAYGFLDSPESTEPGVHQHRLTAAAIWSKPLSGGRNISATAAFGRNFIEDRESDAFLIEGTYLCGHGSLFARWEHVMKDELEGVPPGSHMVNKFLIGGVRDIARRDGFDIGFGAYAGFHIFPDALEPFYGKNPVSVGVFVRIRPSRMEHDMGGKRKSL